MGVDVHGSYGNVAVDVGVTVGVDIITVVVVNVDVVVCVGAVTGLC